MLGKRRGRGRPKKEPKGTRNKTISFRLHEEDYERIKYNAKLKGLSIADYVISLMNISERGEEYEDDIW